MSVVKSFWAWSCLLIPLIKCLWGHKSLGSLCSVVKTLIVSLVRRTDRRTMSPIELSVDSQKRLVVCFLNSD